VLTEAPLILETLREFAVVEPFRVWVRALGNSSRFRVEGAGNARWLLDRFKEELAFEVGEPEFVDEANGTSSFDLPYGFHSSRAILERLVGRIPEVQLMAEPDE
jgi:hypothetical protein